MNTAACQVGVCGLFASLLNDCPQASTSYRDNLTPVEEGGRQSGTKLEDREKLGTCKGNQGRKETMGGRQSGTMGGIK